MTQDPYVYAVRTCNFDMSSFRDANFIWPTSGMVYAPDFLNSTQCGNGLHACLLNDEYSQFSDYLHLGYSVKYLVLKILKSDIISLGDKIKFPKCEVVFCSPSRFKVQEFLFKTFPKFKSWKNNYLFKDYIVRKDLVQIGYLDTKNYLFNCSYSKMVNINHTETEVIIESNTIVNVYYKTHLHIEGMHNSIVIDTCNKNIIRISHSYNTIIANDNSFIFYVTQHTVGNTIIINDKVIKIDDTFIIGNFYLVNGHTGKITVLKDKKPTRHLPKSHK